MVRVFISYSHDSAEHLHNVLMLANRLRNDGVEAILDRYVDNPAEGWPRWMVNQIRESDRILVVCTRNYMRRFEGQPTFRGTGADWEGAVITQVLYENEQGNKEFTPVVFGAQDRKYIPIILRPRTYYVLNDQYQRLYRTITGQPEIVAPQIGRLRRLPPVEIQNDFLERFEWNRPKYKSRNIEQLSASLQEELQRYASLSLEGADVSKSLATILDLKRKLRSGPSVEAGDVLQQRYLLAEQIGYGGFATVWRGFDMHLGSTVAIKILHGQHSGDRGKIERFFRGARKMANLSHPGVVPVLNPECEDEGFRFFVMQFLEGGDLRTSVLSGKLGTLQAFQGLFDIGKALEHAHSCGLIHRDVKPANILLGGHGEMKLTDFDLVHAFDTTGGTRTAAMLGTYVYAAPECLSDGSRVDERADVYSLAMTMIFSLLGRDLPPQMLRDPWLIIRKLPVEAATQKALERATAFAVEERFPSVEEFLACCLRSGGAGAMTSIPVESKMVGRARLNPRYRFENFVEGPSNRLALAAAKTVAQSPSERFNPLVLFGGFGLGKTHLLQAIAWATQHNHETLKVKFIDSEEFTNNLFASIRSDSLDELRDDLRRCDVLILDNIGFLSQAERPQEELLQTLVTLRAAGRQIVVSAELPPRQLNLDHRLQSFLEGGVVVNVEVPNQNTKVAIVREKARLDEVEFPVEVAEFVSQRSGSNIRELEGLYRRLVAVAELSGKTVDLGLAERALEDLLPIRRTIRGADVVKSVAKHYDVSVDQIKSHSRSRELAFPRQVAMYFCKQLAGLSYSEIGRLFKGKHHSTVMYSVEKIEKLIEVDAGLRMSLNEIKEALER